jgi:hypothetical protein
MLARSVAIAHPIGTSAARRKAAGRTADILTLGVLVGLLPWAASVVINHVRVAYLDPGPGKPATAHYYAAEYTRDAYPRWSRDNGGNDCPHQLADLNPYTNREDNGTADPWGNPMRMTCADHAIEVRSAGPDGDFYTDDDIQLRSE